MGGVLAVLEQRDGALKKVSQETLTAARSLADQLGVSAEAVMVGPPGIDVSAVGTYGAEKLHVVEDESLRLYQAGAYAAAVSERAKDGGHAIVVLGATAMGRDLAPRVAARLDCPLAVDVTSIDGSDGISVTRPVFSGKAIYTLKISGSPCVISVRPNVFTPREAEKEVVVETMAAPDATLRARTTSVKEPESTRADVTEAGIVVSGGRGQGAGELQNY